MVVVDREPEVQQLQLTVVSIQQITTDSAVFPYTPHILTKPVESRAFLTVLFGVFAMTLSNVILERLDPINLVGLLQRTREHRRLSHCRVVARSDMLPSNNTKNCGREKKSAGQGWSEAPVSEGIGVEAVG